LQGVKSILLKDLMGNFVFHSQGWDIIK